MRKAKVWDARQLPAYLTVAQYGELMGMMLGIEAKKEAPDEVLTCAARGFVGVARHLLGPMATNPQFAEEISRGIKEMLLDTEDLKVTRGVEGKEAKFMDELGFGTERLLRLKEEALANYRQVNEEGHADGLDVAMEHLRRCAQAALKEEVTVDEQPDEDRVKQSERDYEEQKRAFLKRAVMQQLGRKAGKGGLRILSETQMEEKAAAAMAQLKENTWEKRISTP